MRISIIALTLVLGLSPIAKADQASVLAQIFNSREMIQTTGQVMEEAMIDFLAGMFIAQGRQVSDEELRPLSKAFAEELISKMTPAINDAVAQYLRQNFSQNELQALLDFYTSPIGVKFVDHQATMMIMGSQIGEKIGAEVGESMVSNPQNYPEFMKALADLEKKIGL
jgi:hypothetical protein